MGCKKTLKELADLLGVELQGDPRCIITGIAPLDKAVEGDLSFLTNIQYRQYLVTTKASAVILSKEEASTCKVHALISNNPRLTLAKTAKLFEKPSESFAGIHPTAVIIGEASQIPESVSIGPHVVLGKGVILGERVVVGASTVV